MYHSHFEGVESKQRRSSIVTMKSTQLRLVIMVPLNESEACQLSYGDVL